MSEEGVWLDQIPYEPPIVECVGCGDPLQWHQRMVAVVDGKSVVPLCRPCFDERHVPGVSQ